MAEEINTLRAHKAELVAALTDIRDMTEYDQDDAHRLRGMAKVFLARYESATPAKHPDTEPKVIGGYEGSDRRRYWWTGGAWIYPGQEVAIISARNQESAR